METQSTEKTKKCPKCGEEILTSAKVCKHCQSDLRNWFATHKILTGILILIVIGIIYSVAGGKNNSNMPLNGSNVSEAVVKEKAQEQVNKPKEWISVIKQQSTTKKQSDTFTLKSGKQKIVYSYTSTGPIQFCAIYIVKEGESLDKNGGFPEVMLNKADSGETMARKSPGQYYLEISPSDGTCEAEVFEER